MRKHIFLTTLILLNSLQVNVATATELVDIINDEKEIESVIVEESNADTVESQEDEISEEVSEVKKEDINDSELTSESEAEIDDVEVDEALSHEEIHENDAETVIESIEEVEEPVKENEYIKSRAYVSSTPEVLLESIQLSKYEGKPGDKITVSLLANSSTPISEIKVSFLDANNIGPVSFLTFNNETNRFEGDILLEDNLRAGSLKLSSIVIKNQKTSKYYYDANLEKSNAYDFSNYVIQVRGSHGPYIDFSTMKIDSLTHPEKTTGLSFKIVNPQYVMGDSIYFSADFKSDIPINASSPNQYNDRLKMDNDGNVTSKGEYNHLLYKISDDIYKLKNIDLRIYDVSKTKEQYSAKINVDKEISFKYEKYYSADPIFNVNSASMNKKELLSSDFFELYLPAKNSVLNPNYITIEWIGDKTGSLVSVKMNYNDIQKRFEASHQIKDWKADNYKVKLIRQNYDGVNNTVYNGDVSEGKTDLSKLNLKVNPLDILLPADSVRKISYLANIALPEYPIYENAIGSGVENKAKSSTTSYTTGNSSNILVSQEITNSMGTWLKISYGLYNSMKYEGWVSKEALEKVIVKDSKDVFYAATVTGFKPIYAQPLGLEGSIEIDKTNNHYLKNVEVVKEVITKSSYILLMHNGKELGWVEKDVVTPFEINNNGIGDPVTLTVDKAWSINTKPWGVPGFEQVDSGQGYYGKEVVEIDQASTPRSLYSLIQYQGKTIGWIDRSALSNKYYSIKSSSDKNYIATVTKPWAIMTSPWGTFGAKKAMDNNLIGKQIEVIQEKVTDRSTYALIKQGNKQLGWIDKTGIQPISVKSTKKVNYNAKVIKAWSINTQPWGVENFKEAAKGSDYLGKEVKVVEEKVTQRATYALIQLNGKNIGWIDKGAIQNSLQIKSTKKVRYIANITRDWSINTQPWGVSDFKQVATGKKYYGKEIEVLEEKTTDRASYALISINGKSIGWIDKGAVSPITVLKTKKVNYTATINKKWSINTQPWGTANFKNISNQSSYWGKKVQVTQEKTTRRSTYAYIRYNGKNIGWIDTGALKK